MKSSQFKLKSKEELKQELVSYAKNLQKSRFDLSMNKLKNVKSIQSLKKDIARIKTLLNVSS